MGNTMFSAASHRLNAINLSSGGAMAPFEVFSLRYIEDLHERKNPLNTPGRHHHTYYEVHCPIAGEQTYQFGGDFIPVGTGEVMVIAPGVFHSIPYSGEDLCKNTIAFALTDAAGAGEFAWICEALEGGAPFVKAAATPRLRALFEMIFSEVNEARGGWLANVRRLVLCLFTELGRILAPEKGQPGEAREKNEALVRVVQMERFIHDNLSEPITCGMLSEHMNLSVKQLNRDSQQARQMSLRRLIDNIKLAEARRLLGDPALSREDVSFSIGFLDTSCFNRFFKRNCGITPGEYRSVHAREGG